MYKVIIFLTEDFVCINAASHSGAKWIIDSVKKREDVTGWGVWSTEERSWTDLSS